MHVDMHDHETLDAYECVRYEGEHAVIRDEYVMRMHSIQLHRDCLNLIWFRSDLIRILRI